MGRALWKMGLSLPHQKEAHRQGLHPECEAHRALEDQRDRVITGATSQCPRHSQPLGDGRVAPEVVGRGLVQIGVGASRVSFTCSTHGGRTVG